ncbi:MAG: NusA N-terminal domain-containing protein, partial [Opitutae bacterium]
MSTEILTALEYMEKEKGIDREEMIATISSALVTAAQKSINAGQELRVEINPKSGAISAWVLLEVVDSVSDSKRQIHVEKAGDYIDNPRLGQFVEKEIDPGALGRIAAQTAKQVIIQKLREAERNTVFDDFNYQEGHIVQGTVQRRDRSGSMIID